MTIWIILMLATFQGALGLAALNANAELWELGRQIYRRHGLDLAAPLGCLIALAGAASMTAWVVFAFQAEDWRFAAIPAIPFLIGWAGRVLHSWGRKRQA